jgi:Fic family protein
MAVRKLDDPEFYTAIEEKNYLRQYDLLVTCIEIGLKKGIEAFDKYMLWALNSAAIANISQFGGRYRRGPIYVGDHIPPPHWEVPDLMDRCISYVHESWSGTDRTIELPAYVLWRMNWIHPFVEGNGRTARAACYYLICMAYGNLLPGKTTVPERIRKQPQPYYDALKAADRAWANGHVDVSEMTKYLQRLVLDQLSE